MKAFIFCFFVFAIFILIVNGEIQSQINFETGEVQLINDMVKNNKPTQNEKIRPKREMPWRWCGKLLNKMIAEICPSCFDSPPSKIKPDIVVKCCLYGCTSEDIKQDCCLN
uniref:Uncharacterized protein n=1 Tax=Panagrolaimus sp. PS1159 TaxID=55785 RepID=A0AC35F9R2_9BILA